MDKIFEGNAFEEYLYWQTQDKKTLRKINELIKDITRNGADKGTGDPEPLKHDLTGYWSRKIDKQNRLIYKIEENNLYIAACKGHYE